ncbi:MAG: hypothetical protein WBV11_04170 [Salegentibacter sp.]
MARPSSNNKFTRILIGNFIFGENKAFRIDPRGLMRPSRNIGFYKLGGRFISIRFEQSFSSKAGERLQSFRCRYKMMKQFNCSLN